jgi:hypothetical protein
MSYQLCEPPCGGLATASDSIRISWAASVLEREQKKTRAEQRQRKALSLRHKEGFIGCVALQREICGYYGDGQIGKVYESNMKNGFKIDMKS